MMTKKITLMASTLLFLGALSAAEEEAAHHDLAWLGFLNLPKAKLAPSNLLKLKKPLELKSWGNEEETVLEWLPPARYEQEGLVAQYYLKFNGSKAKESLKRRERLKSQ